MLYFFTALFGYGLGSISFAYLITRSHGVDIFKVGSGNPGATNVTRALGAKWGRLCFAADFLKGLVAAGWPWLLVPGIKFISTGPDGLQVDAFFPITAEPEACSVLNGPGCSVVAAAGSAYLYSIVGYLAAILGHTYSAHLRWVTGKFLGGKAVATTMGGLLALTAPVALTATVVWSATYHGFGRIVGLASVVFAASLPLLAVLWGEPPVVFWFLLLLAGFVIYKHRSNLARLMRGEEHAFAKPVGTAEGTDGETAADAVAPGSATDGKGSVK